MYLVMRWRAFLSALVCGALLIGVIFALSAMPVSETEIARLYLDRCGWVVSDEPTEVSEYTIPLKWDNVMQEYNKIQQQAGFDLGRYCGEKVIRVRFEVIGYGDYVYANVFVFKGRVIGGDISSTAIDGFMLPLSKNNDDI